MLPSGLCLAGSRSLKNLDIQYTIGLASDVPVLFISVGGTSQDGVFGFLDLANFVLDQPNPPNVLTTSYGSNENELDPSLYGYVIKSQRLLLLISYLVNYAIRTCSWEPVGHLFSMLPVTVVYLASSLKVALNLFRPFPPDAPSQFSASILVNVLYR